MELEHENSLPDLNSHGKSTTMSSITETQIEALVKYMRYSLIAVVAVLTVAGVFKYPGHSYIYLLFSVVSNVLLYFGFRKNAIFFDAFIGIFFWIGFWLKLTVRICFSGGVFNEQVGYFDGSGAAFDQALLVASCGLLGLIVASVVREKLIFKYPKNKNDYSQYGILNFYKNNRSFVLIGYVVLFSTIAITNVYLGIYQKGEITQTTLPMGLNGLYKWLMLFGLTSLTAVILRCEFAVKQEAPYLIVTLNLLEIFLTNVSLLSRGMILHVSALVLGVYSSFKTDVIRLNFRFVATSFLIFVTLFVSSILAVNYVRYFVLDMNGQQAEILAFKEKVSRQTIISDQESKSKSSIEAPEEPSEALKKSTTNIVSADGMAKPLFLDRWVGMEGVMSVSSSPKLGWNLWAEAWQEKYSENAMSFYDKNLIKSVYSNTDFTKHHFISLPGVVAFCFYPGSFLFLFGCMLLLGLLAALVELSVYKLGGNNLILCSLMAEVVAYRFASFGYVPAQSYLLFGTIFLNLLIIYFFNKFAGAWNDRGSNRIPVSR